jgi:restriction endonuclease S subunit
MQYNGCVHIKISQLADVINGYTFRGAINKVKDGDVFVLQAKDIIQGQDIQDTKNLTPIDFTGTRTASFLKKNDVLVVSRGTGIGSFRSTVFNLENTNIIASSSVLIIRIKNKEILPEYLSIYINSQEGQNKILETVVGSYIQAISRKKFDEEMKIPIPTLQKQKALIELNKNIKQQEKIYDRKKQLKQQIISATITNLTKK